MTTKTQLTVFQHSWSARDLDPDGSAYASQAEAEAAEVRVARDQLEDFTGEDIAEAITEHTDADDVDDARLDVIRALDADDVDDALTDAEAVMAAEGLRGYDSAVYPTTLTLDTVAVLGGISLEVEPGETPSAAAVLAMGVTLAERVAARWESGDLAAAVADLTTWATEVRHALPSLDYGDDG